MKESNLLRLSLVIKAGNSQTFKSGLIKLIQMVLFEASDYALDIDSIRRHISEDYELEFTNEEILKSLKAKDTEIERIEETRSTIVGLNKWEEKDAKYKLTEKTIHKLKTNEANNPYKDMVGRFVEEYKVENKTSEQIEDLLKRYIYYVFNSNKKTLLLLFNNEKAKIINHSEMSFNEDEKRLINDFLNWDDKSKNHFIYNAVSYSVDYCMLTVKKDYSSYSQLFNGKVFYLDANVIFRMAGVNNEERKAVTNSFIKKCKDNGITVKYTNITYQEIVDTVNKQVNILRSFYRGKKPVSTKHYESFSNPYNNLDFIRMHDKWGKVAGTKYNDYNAFEKSIIREIDGILKDFSKVDFISFDSIDKTTFSGLVDSLKEYKKKNRAYWTEQSIAIDVNNYLFIYKKRESKSGTSFIDISDYFITTDGNLYEWGKKILPSTIPISVLPSVWHSLLLKFKGRTDDDFKAFTLFLNLRYKVSDEDFDERRPEILSLVQSLEEPTDLKNMILTEISANLMEKYKGITDIYEIVEDAKNEVIESEVKRIYKEQGQPLIDEGKAEGRVQTLFTLAESNAQKKVDLYNKISSAFEKIKEVLGIIVTFGSLAFVGVFGASKVSSVFKTEVWGYDLLSWTSVISLFFVFGLRSIFTPIKKKFFSKDFETLKNEEFQKLLSSLNIEKAVKFDK